MTGTEATTTGEPTMAGAAASPADTIRSDAPVPHRPRGLVARGLTRLIGWYQVAHQDRPSPCRFVPSCSTYALEALEARGALRGSFLALHRLARCHPWGGHGFDPVPPPPPARLERADRRV
jgi:putative membrane protein insertion efficiency factor